eukprot:CAMPEP_0169105072 /NCGR_PEP_ID=MMETSP1015-20121227/23595_1 /TAXON_ID=342587 /ORGANISM="Karlodinium micrum, Strain CCMP2283" /LENGTH=109 /DNA_ID=CAMNT_0009166395 /DNA_START=115 /DNA_END=444 /DNA_ORIENTATION=-
MKTQRTAPGSSMPKGGVFSASAERDVLGNCVEKIARNGGLLAGSQAPPDSNGGCRGEASGHDSKSWAAPRQSDSFSQPAMPPSSGASSPQLLVRLCKNILPARTAPAAE